MTRLVQELSRLFFLPGQEAALSQPLSASLGGNGGACLPLLGPEQGVRTLVVDAASASDWDAVSALYEGVQEDLELPAPAISISPEAGFQVWFSLTEPISLAAAEQFLAAIRRKYLADVPENKIALHPGRDSSSAEVSLVPSCHQPSGRWSAFIDPTLGSMFADEPGLEMAPNLDRQAAMLAGTESIKGEDFLRGLTLLQGQCETEALPRQLSAGSGFTDPKTFLLAVMNDPSMSAPDRIRAAEALLPYFEKAVRE